MATSHWSLSTSIAMPLATGHLLHSYCLPCILTTQQSLMSVHNKHTWLPLHVPMMALKTQDDVLYSSIVALKSLKSYSHSQCMAVHDLSNPLTDNLTDRQLLVNGTCRLQDSESAKMTAWLIYFLTREFTNKQIIYNQFVDWQTQTLTDWNVSVDWLICWLIEWYKYWITS